MTTTAERPAAPAEHGELARSIDPYHPATNAENFDLDGWLARFDPRLLATSEGRRTLTRLDPLLFAWTYMRKHLKDDEDRITFADAHFLWVRLARRLIGPSRGPKQDRRALVAPRASGKTTWWFLILPLWAGAQEHRRFAAAFADGGTQAELHLATFKRELGDNPLLRRDFPDFCEPARRHSGKTVSDTQNMLYTKTGFAFAARGIDSTSLGMKIDQVRPDFLIFDDIEPPESTYSAYQRDKRLATVQNAILPLNESARVVIVGTVTMPGSIVHSLVRDHKGEETEEWITDERFKTFHTRPIVRRADGSERSVWPGKWPLAYLNSIRHTRSYRLNYDNDPRGRKGDYWSDDDIAVVDRLPLITKRYLFVDPFVVKAKTSDPCGLAVVGWSPASKVARSVTAIMQRIGIMTAGAEYAEIRRDLTERLLRQEINAPDDQPAGELAPLMRLPRVVILDAWDARFTGKELKRHILATLSRNPGIQAVIVENNQGGDLWLEVLSDLPVKLVTYGVHESKEVRFARALDFYQKLRVIHAKPMPALEDQLTGFPAMPNDDIADAVCAGVLRLLLPKPIRKDRTITPR